MRISLKVAALTSLSEEMDIAFNPSSVLGLGGVPSGSWCNAQGVRPTNDAVRQYRGGRRSSAVSSAMSSAVSSAVDDAVGSPVPGVIGPQTPYSQDAFGGIQYALPHSGDASVGSPTAPGESPSAATADSASEPGLEQIYRENAPAIHRMMLRLGIPERYAEDATNDVFVAALPRWHEFRGDSTRRTWLFGFALKVAANQRRKLGRAGEEIALAAAHDFDTSPSADADPFEQASARQAIGQLESLLDTLTLEERGLWLLVHYEDVTVSDAAEVLGISAPKAYVMVKWAHSKLIKAWKRSNPPEARGAR